MPTVYIQSSCFLPTPSAGAGAVEYLVWKMAEGLGRRGWDVTLFALEGSQVPNEKLITIPAEGDVAERERKIKHLMRDWILREPPDVIFDHSLHMFAALRKDIPYVAMSHGMAPLPTWARNVVFTSKHHGKLHKARNPHALLLGVDLADFPPAGTSDREGLFWAGRILPYKRLHWACEIAQRAGLQVTVAGPVVDQAYFDEVRRTYVGTMRYLGALDRADVLRHMAASRYFLFTSDETEPAGLVMLEAMACGTPVIAVNDGSAHEYIGGGGWILMSVEEAASMIRHGYGPHLHENARRTVEDGFTIDAMVDRAEEYLRAAMDGRQW